VTRRSKAPLKLPGWAALAAACLGQFMSVLDGTIVNVALPAVRRSLDLGPVELQWVINAYLLTFGGLLLLGGRLGDHFGRKRIYLLGAVLFSLASCIGGLAPTGATLIAARAIQGIGAALLAPGTLSLIATAYPEARARGRALGIWSATAGSAASAGVLLGGVLTDTLGWRWVFFVNIPIGLLVLALGGAALVESRGSDDESAHLDVPGALLITAAMTLLVYAVVDTDRYAWGSLHTLVPLEASILLLLAFIVFEAHSEAPLMPLGILRRPTVGAGVLAVSLFGVMLTGSYYFLSLYLQGPRGLSPLEAGLAFLPNTGLSIVSAAVAPRLCVRFGPRATLVAGLSLAALSMLWLSQVTAHGSLVATLLVPSSVFGIATGLCFVCVTVLVTAGVERSHTGLASGMINAGRQIGGSVGLAALAVVAASRTRALLASHSASPAQALAAGYGRAFLICAAVGAVAIVIVLLRAAPREAALTETYAVTPALAAAGAVDGSPVLARPPESPVAVAVAAEARPPVIAFGAQERSLRGAVVGAVVGAVALVLVLVRRRRE